MLETLRELRTNEGLSQEEVARRVGISKQYYSEIEREKRRLTYDMAISIASVFNRKPDDIFLTQKSSQRVPKFGFAQPTGTDD